MHDHTATSVLVSPPPRLVRAAIPASIFAAVFLAFWPTLDNGLVNLDDTGVLLENTGYRGLGPENIAWMFRSYSMGHWQPLTWFSYAVDYTIAGGKLAPAQIHLTNLLLHAANAVLLYGLARRFFRAAGLPTGVGAMVFAAAGVMLWAVHPLRVESVAWATERRDVLSAFFLLLTLHAYLAAFPRGSAHPVSKGAYIVSVVLLALSLLSKAWGMTFFCVAIVLDWYPLGRLPDDPRRWFRQPHRIVLFQKLPYIALALGSAWQARNAIRAIGAEHSWSDWPLTARIAQACYGLVWYPSKTLWPTSLAPLYDMRIGLNPLASTYVLCYAIVMIGAAAVLLARRRAPAVSAALTVYAILIAPVLGFSQAGDQFVADRYSYLSTIPLVVAGAGGLFTLALRLRPLLAWALPLACLPLIALLTAATRQQTAFWHDSETLWRSACLPRSDRAMAYVNYANCLMAAERLDEAAEQYRTATQLQPASGQAWLALATALRKQRDWPGAEAAYRRAAERLHQAYMPLVNLGNMLREIGRSDEALLAYREAVRAVESLPDPAYRSGVPYLSLGAELAHRGDAEGARRSFMEAEQYPACREEARRQLERLALKP